MLYLFFITLGLVSLLTMSGLALVSWFENERRATKVAVAFALGVGGSFLLLSIGPDWIQVVVEISLILVVLFSLFIFLIPIGRVDQKMEVPRAHYDERDIMFARARLVPASENYQAYYAMRPENEMKDQLTRNKPGLLSLQAEFANPLLFSAPHASFTVTESLHSISDGPVSANVVSLPAPAMKNFIKGLARYYGALDVGITELKPYHVYSHIGRGSGNYGEPIHLDHRYALAFSVEMDHQMIAANPAAPGVMESAKQYVEAARVAIQLAAAIRYLGHSARAHIDGDYRVICPLVARDAGLGEIGRMGLLMTPKQGPRVRLGVVTTTVELIPDPPTCNAAVIDFCIICQKCAENCPVQAIPYGDRQEIDGALRWRINADTCFRYWNVVGTDCGRCMTVCPYSHPDNIYHNLVRWGNLRSGAFRRFAVKLDDLFYGQQPETKETPAWTRIKS